ncbi:hypothetical protein HYV22_00265 [Candidatus Gottesmanbacteria bacterium]|nr:hypothetical protein [Candidatus Gottesmanbacteria bacterium]
MTNQIPEARIGSIGGSNRWGQPFPGVLGRDDIRVIERYSAIDTPFGQVGPFKLIEVCGESVLHVRMHGMYLEDRVVPPWVAAKGVAWVFQQAGARYVFGDGSVGGIQDFQGNPLEPWSAVVMSDYKRSGMLIPNSIPPAGISRTNKAFYHRMAAPFCSCLRQKLVEAARQQPEFRVVQDGGIYLCTGWGEFESVFEIDKAREEGCTIVGQTIAYEAIALREIAADGGEPIHFAAMCVVSNNAENGGVWIGDSPDAMRKFYEQCPLPTSRAVIGAIDSLIREGIDGCLCGNFAITGFGIFPHEDA